MDKEKQMKYFSEITNEFYDDVEALTEAETAVTSASNSGKECEEEESKKVPKALSKKQLASNVENAEQVLKEAYANYEMAKQQVEEISKKYLEDVDAIMEPAKKAVTEAERAKYDAIRKFNESFGAYQTTYTGAKAAEELMKAINSLNAKTLSLFRNNFWF